MSKIRLTKAFFIHENRGTTAATCLFRYRLIGFYFRSSRIILFLDPAFDHLRALTRDYETSNNPEATLIFSPLIPIRWFNCGFFFLYNILFWFTLFFSIIIYQSRFQIITVFEVYPGSQLSFSSVCDTATSIIRIWDGHQCSPVLVYSYTILSQ